MDDFQSYVEKLNESALRDTLSKFMEDVPPITVTTRPLLETMLCKYLEQSKVPNDINHNALNSDEDSSIDVSLVTVLQNVIPASVEKECVDKNDAVNYLELKDNRKESSPHEESNRYGDEDEDEEPPKYSASFHRKSLLTDEERDCLLSQLPSFKREPLHSNLDDVNFDYEEISFRHQQKTKNESLHSNRTDSKGSSWKTIILIILLLIGVFVYLYNSDINYSNPIDNL